MKNVQLIKNILKLVCPPIILNLFRREGYHYSGKYTTYKEAQKFSKTYNDKNSMKKFFTPEDVEVSGRFNILPILVLSYKKGNITILDYGGGANPAYSYIENSTKIETQTYVIEQENFCKKIIKKIPNRFKNRVLYYRSLNQLGTLDLDIACFNSSIQYLENYKEILDNIIKLNPLYILITRTNFHNGEENYYALEHYPVGSSHPYIFFSYRRFTELLESNNYNLVFSNKYNVNKYKHKSIDGSTFYHRDMLFKYIK